MENWMNPEFGLCKDHGGPLFAGCSRCTLEALCVLAGEHPQGLEVSDHFERVVSWSLLQLMLLEANFGRGVQLQVSSDGPKNCAFRQGYPALAAFTT